VYFALPETFSQPSTLGILCPTLMYTSTVIMQRIGDKNKEIIAEAGTGLPV
jgi:hypothetical protein